MKEWKEEEKRAMVAMGEAWCKEDVRLDRVEMRSESRSHERRVGCWVELRVWRGGARSGEGMGVGWRGDTSTQRG